MAQHQGNRRAPEPQRHTPPPRGPEMKFGPFAGGVGVAIWLNTIDADDGTSRRVRSISLAPRRYRDRQSGEWRDSSAYYPSDIPALIYALQKAQEFVITTPIPGESREAGSDDEPAY